MRRRRFLALAGAAAAGLAVEGLGLEPRRLAVTRHALPAAGRPGLTFAQISDLHLRAIGGIHHRIGHALREAAPDLVLITGDSVDRPDALPLLRRFLSLLDPATPKYAILGNWEHWSGVDLAGLRQVYAEANARLLVNQSVLHRHDPGHLRITGLDDLIGGTPDLAAALAGEAPAALHLLLCHCPEHRDLLREQSRAIELGGAPLRRPVDAAHLGDAIVLAGHTHGGQINLAGWAPQRPRGSGRYVAGRYRGGGAPDLYVSRGIGTSVLPVRLGSAPEIAIFTAA